VNLPPFSLHAGGGSTVVPVDNIFTASRMSGFFRCAKKHRYGHIMGFRPVSSAGALHFGSLVHTGLEHWWQSKGNLDKALAEVEAKMRSAEEYDPWLAIKLSTVLYGYNARWNPTFIKYEVLGVESEFYSDLLDLDGKKVEGVRIGGKIDGIVLDLDTGKKWVVEHKTSSEDLTAGSNYWAKLRMDSQVSIYIDGAATLGHQVEGVLYDVLKKSKLKPHLATPMDKRKFKKDGALYANQRANDETLEEFSDRVAAEITENVDSWYARTEVVRTEQEIRDARADLYYATMAMIEDEKRPDSPRNTSACFQFGACPFLGVCDRSVDLFTSGKFTNEGGFHPELSVNINPEEGE
jgi:hypothetical protein